MGIFKSIGKVFKKIGRGIKKAFKKFGKFMGKAGILGQIAMMFIIPGIGGALMKGLGGAFKGVVGATAEGVKAAAVTSQAAVTAGNAATSAVGTGTATAAQTATIKAGEAATKSLTKLMDKGILKGSIKGTLEATRGTGLLGSSSGLANGVGSVLQAAGNFVKVGVKGFKTVTEGISSFISEFGKVGLNKIPGVNIGTAAPNVSAAWSNVQNNVMTNASQTVQAFNTSIGYTPPATGGLANYVPKANVTVASTKAAKLTDTAAGIVDGPPLLKQTEGINLAKTSANLDLDKTLPATQEVTLGGFAEDPTAIKLYEVKQPSLLDKAATPEVIPETKGFIAKTFEKGKTAFVDNLGPQALVDRAVAVPGKIADGFFGSLENAGSTIVNTGISKAMAGTPETPIYNQNVSGGIPTIGKLTPEASTLASAPDAFVQAYAGRSQNGMSYGAEGSGIYGQFFKNFAPQAIG